MSCKFNIWLTGSNSWLMRGGPPKCSSNQSDAGVFTLEEAVEHCSLVLSGRPPAAMVAVPGEPGDQVPEPGFTCTWEERLQEVEANSLAKGIVEGVAEGLEVGLPNVAEKLKQAAGLLDKNRKNGLGDVDGRRPHEYAYRSLKTHGVQS